MRASHLAVVAPAGGLTTTVSSSSASLCRSGLRISRTHTAMCAAVGSSSATTMTHMTALTHSRRAIIVPRQLKAYGGTFSLSVGERADHLPGHLVLQSLSPSRTQNSPLLAKPVKTKSVESFSEMWLAPELVNVLANDLQITTPSPIQQTAIETILQHKNTLIAAPHGEGKTLAYLLPLYQNMMKDRDVYKIPLRERRPRMILMAHTQELVEQLQAVCHRLDAATGLTSASFTSRKRAKYHLSRLLKDTMPDVLIMDPKVILRLIRTRRLFLDDLRYVAVDEADILCSSLHDHDAVHLLTKIHKRALYKHLWPVQTQVVFSSPYITRKLEYFVGKRFPDTVPCLFRHNMHRPSTTLQHRFYPIRRESEKFTMLEHLLRKHGHRPIPVDTDDAVVAVHTTPHKLTRSLAACREQVLGAARPEADVGTAVQPRDAAASTLHITPLHRTALAETANRGSAVRATGSGEEATSSSSAAASDYVHDPELRVALERVRPLNWEHLTTVAAPFTCPISRTIFGEGKRFVIFFRTTDAATALFHQLRAAGYAVSVLHASLPWAVRRAMFEDFASGRTNILCATDLAARGLDVHVDVVVNFDMPTNSVVYLSRAGRTARMGRQGLVCSLYTKQQGVIVSAVRAFLKRDIPLEGLSNSKTHMMQPRYAEWRTHKLNALTRAYVSMITTKAIPAHLERTYLHHNATWRPLFHPRTTGQHGGVAPRQQQKLMDNVMEQAVWYRRGQLARRKGGRAKFGRRDMRSGVWNDVGGVASRQVANAQQSPRPADSAAFGAPSGPPV